MHSPPETIEQTVEHQNHPDQPVIRQPFTINDLQIRPAGLEPTTSGLGNRRSIRLSYGRNSLHYIILQQTIHKAKRAESDTIFYAHLMRCFSKPTALIMFR